MLIIGITGTLGAGKGTIVSHLVEKYNFKHYSVRDFLKKKLLEKGIVNPNRDDFTQLANELRLKNAPSFIIDQLYDEALKNGKNAVIESIRTVGEIESLRQKKNFFLLAIDAPAKARYLRIVERKSETDHISFEIFIENEKREMESIDKHCQNLKKCIAQADFILDNSGSVKQLRQQIDNIYHEIITNYEN